MIAIKAKVKSIEIALYLLCYSKNELSKKESHKNMDDINYFLQYVPKLHLTDLEINKLTQDITYDEVSLILENEVDLDSSPGQDGISYKLLNFF